MNGFLRMFFECPSIRHFAVVSLCSQLLIAPSTALAQGHNETSLLDSCHRLIRQGKSHPKCTPNAVRPLCARLESRGETHALCRVTSGSSDIDASKKRPEMESQSAKVEPSSEAAERSTGAAGSSGPDLAGIRIGMSPSEARAALKRRTDLKVYRDYSLDLSYEGVDGKAKIVPNGKYVALMHAYTSGNERRDAILVSFASIPGREKVISVARSVLFPPESYPAIDVYVRALEEKFGKPAMQRDRVGSMGKFGTGVGLTWFLGPTGTPTNQSANRKYPLQCQSRYPTNRDAPSSDLREVHSWFLSGISQASIEAKQKYVQQCGQIVVSADLFYVTGSRQDLRIQPKFLGGVHIRIADLKLALESIGYAVQHVSAARKTEESSRMGQARSRKPDL